MRGLLCCAFLVGCSGSASAPLDEYPPLTPSPAPPSSTEPPPAPRRDEVPRAPVEGAVKLVDGPVWIEGVTTQGHLVFGHQEALAILPRGQDAPVTIIPFFEGGNDSIAIRGSFVAVWSGGEGSRQELRVWSQGTTAPMVHPASLTTRFFAKPNDNAFAFLSTEHAQGTVWAMRAGQAQPTMMVDELNLVGTECRIQVAFTANHLLVRRCRGFDEAAKLVTYNVDGAGQLRVVAEGVTGSSWLNRARTRIVAHVGSSASLYDLEGTSPPVAVDTNIVDAEFSRDDSTLVYLRKDGRIWSTNLTNSPRSVANGALALLAVSPDAKHVAMATKGTPDRLRTDITLIDAAARPPVSRALADKDAAVVGLTERHLVYLTDKDAARPSLHVAPLSGGAPELLSDAALHPTVVDDKVIWLEGAGTARTATLKVKSLSKTEPAAVLATGFDIPSSRVEISFGHVFIGTKDGLWRVAF